LHGRPDECLYRYLDSVLPDEFGVRRKPLFFLKKEYWGFKSKQPDRDLQTWLADVSAQFAAQSNPKPKVSFFKKLQFPSFVTKFTPRIPFLNRTRRTTQQTPSTLSLQKPPQDIEVTLLHDSAHNLSHPAALRVVNLRKQFPTLTAIHNSNFIMHQGELLAILGANGSGKSTTCHILTGITPATAGDALVDDRVSLLDERVVGWCPQHDILFDELTPLEHVHSLPDGFMVRFRCMRLLEGLVGISLKKLGRKDYDG
jgi:ATPase subunit of ABC transporter with duplicated ATPase domains